MLKLSLHQEETAARNGVLSTGQTASGLRELGVGGRTSLPGWLQGRGWGGVGRGTEDKPGSVGDGL